MQTLSLDTYLALRKDAVVLEFDHHGEKVLRLVDGTYLKLFRRKRLISSAAWYPYAQRFADNAQALRERRIACPQVIEVYRVPAIKRDAVLYRPLEGMTLRQALRAGQDAGGLHEAVFRFIDHLHEQGIYFRSLHLGNIILMPQGKLGLIDIADMRVSKRPLFGYLRRRNLQHLYRDPIDRAWLESVPHMCV